jgi:tRNA pseudouridine55 synthase
MKSEADPITDDEWLLRRVPLPQFRTDRLPIISPNAFEPRIKGRDVDADGISLYRAACLNDPGEILEPVAAERRQEYGIVRLSVSFLKSLGLSVRNSPDDRVKGHVVLPELNAVDYQRDKGRYVPIKLVGNGSKQKREHRGGTQTTWRIGTPTGTCMPIHHGLLVVDKPTGLTSRDVVNRMQKRFPRGTRIGHMGTLDPLATGVLVLGIGEGTRLTEFVQDMDKVYRAGILLGAVSDTDDADGQVSAVAVAVPPLVEELRNELARLTGDVSQVPPSYSAIKVTGRRAYDLARRGDKVDLTPRTVRIYEITLVSYSFPHLELEVRCGKGTYIRSLARDLGERLGCGALIATLLRLRIGPFTTDLAVPLDSADEPKLLPLAMAVSRLPSLTLEPGQIDFLRQGRAVALKAEGEEESMKAMFTREGNLAGIGKMVGGELRPVRILAQNSWEKPA